MTDSRRVIAVLILAVLTLSVVAPAVMAQEEGASPTPTTGGNTTETATSAPTQTPTPEPTAEPTPEPTDSTDRVIGGDYTVRELQRGGEIVDERFPSLRVLGEMQAVWVTRYPIGVTKSFGEKGNQEYLAPGDTVKRDRIRMYGSHPFDGANRTYTAKVVYWTVETRGEGENATRVANVTATETHRIEMASGMQQYDDIPLRTFSDRSVRVTMWFEEHPDARWTFRHQSAPTAAPLNINSEGDFWSLVFTRFGWIILLGVPLSEFGARNVVERAENVGPQKGLGWWLGITAVTLGILGFGFWFRTSTVITRLPQIAGLIVCALAFVVFLEGYDSSVKKVRFEQSVLESARSPEGDKVVDKVFQRDREKLVVETDDGHLAIVEKGWKAFLGRLFADPAKIPIEDVKTRIDVDGPWEEALISDPQADEVIAHTPPRVEWDPTLIEETDPAAKNPRGLLERVNVRLITAAIGGVGLGYLAGQAVLGLPWVGALVGALPAVVIGFKARDGFAEFDPAPIHYTQANAILAVRQHQYASATENEKLRDIAWKERLKNPLEAKILRNQFDETVTSKMNSVELGDGATLDEILDEVNDELKEATDDAAGSDDGEMLGQFESASAKSKNGEVSHGDD